jgi:glycosyltransferase involved in cell wall biosynthesis
MSADSSTGVGVTPAGATKVTVLVPCYNSERFLGRCLDSVLNQSYQNLRVVCVNDGSTDSTARILSTYARRDSRVVVKTQPNQGAAAARRTALRHACGDYVCPVDSDDWIDPDCVSSALQKAEETNADVVLFALRHWVGDTVVRHQSLDDLAWPMSGENALENTIDGWKLHGLGLFSRSLFADAYEKFDRYRLVPFNADDFIARIALFFAQRIDRVDACYHYRANPDSSTLKFDERWLGYLSSLEATGQFLKEQGQLNRLAAPFLSDCLKHSNFLFSVWSDREFHIPEERRQEGIARIFQFWSGLPKKGLVQHILKKPHSVRERLRLTLILLNLYAPVYRLMAGLRRNPIV